VAWSLQEKVMKYLSIKWNT